MSMRFSSGRHSMPFGQDELPILNAEEYVDGPRYRLPRPEAAPGAVAKAKGQARNNNRERVVEVEEPTGTAKRLRGRPRLDTKDETAADRRRTQIRLAQRAYRHRKDTAITRLEQKLMEIQMVQKSINKEISKLNDMLLNEGIFALAPHAETRIRSITEGLLRLSSLSSTPDGPLNSGSEEHASGGSGEAIHLSDTSDARNSSSPPSLDSQTSNALAHGGETMAAFSSLDGGFDSNLFGYEVITQATPDNATFPTSYSGAILDMSQPHVGAHHLRSQLVDQTLFSNPPLPASYAFQERNFSRRFHRFTVERAFILATKPNPPPTRFASVFGFTLLFESKEVLVHRLLTVLKRTQDEDLRTWRLASRSLDNLHLNFLERQFEVSGLEGHYATISSMDPETMNPNHPANLENESRIQAMFKTFESLFLFPDDVERLLNRLGIFIPASADTVEVEVDLDALTRAAQTDQGLHVDDYHDPYRRMDMASTNSGYNMSNMWVGDSSVMGRFDMSLPGDHSSSHAMHIAQMLGTQSELSGGITSFITPDYGGTWPSAAGLNKTKITIDVPKFIAETTSRAICLGRSPGVRQRDLIKALKLASGLVT